MERYPLVQRMQRQRQLLRRLMPQSSFTSDVIGQNAFAYTLGLPTQPTEPTQSIQPIEQIDPIEQTESTKQIEQIDPIEFTDNPSVPLKIQPEKQLAEQYPPFAHQQMEASTEITDNPPISNISLRETSLPSVRPRPPMTIKQETKITDAPHPHTNQPAQPSAHTTALPMTAPTIPSSTTPTLPNLPTSHTTEPTPTLVANEQIERMPTPQITQEKPNPTQITDTTMEHTPTNTFGYKKNIGQQESEQRPTHIQQTTQPQEIVRPKVRRGRIEERPSIAPIPSSAHTSHQTATQASHQDQQILPASHISEAGQHQENRQSETSSEADELFQPKVHRTPQEWMAMLQGFHTSSTTPSQPSPSIPTKQVHVTPERDETVDEPLPTEPLPQRAVRFLRPLVGIDPSTVRIHRGSPASHSAALQNAEALTINEEIVLAEDQTLETPASLGLLAHELTHVARQREPRFVPPMLRNQATASPSATPIVPSPTSSLLASADEEVIARMVEGSVIDQAQISHEHRDFSPATSTLGTVQTPPSLEPAVPSVPSVQAPQAAPPTDWNGLPSPWEPLPNWLVTTPTTPNLRSLSPLGPSALPTIAQPISPSYLSGKTNSQQAQQGEMGGQQGQQASNLDGETTTIYAAESGRGLKLTEPRTQAAKPALPRTSEQAPGPDLDDLARQVYTLLKRKLGVEQRRMS